MQVEWDNLRVCPPCLDPRPPQMQPPDVFPEGIPFFDARPPNDRPDRLEDDSSLQSVVGGIVVAIGGAVVTGANADLQDSSGLDIDDSSGSPINTSGQFTYGAQSVSPGALSPLPFTESITASPNSPEPGQPKTIGTPIGRDVLADDVTFITGPVAAPSNT